MLSNIPQLIRSIRKWQLICGKAAVFACVLWSGLAIATVSEFSVPFEKFELENGLTVIVHEDHTLPIVSVSVTYKVGSKDETEGKSGFAHLFEHLMFNGSENYNSEWQQGLSDVGATGVNGFTTADRTKYYQTVPTEALERVLWMESDRMGHFAGAISQDVLDEQREVVKNEKRQHEANAFGRTYEYVGENLYPKGHPYHHPVIGSMDDLGAASVEDAQEWFKSYYGPSNAVLVLSGDISPESARQLVNKYFGDIPPGEPIVTRTEWVPVRTHITRQSAEVKSTQTRVLRVWAIPGDGDADTANLELAAHVLGRGMNSRLHTRLVRDLKIAQKARAYMSASKVSSVFGIYVDVENAEHIPQVEAEIDTMLRSFLDKGPTRDELDTIQNILRSGRIKGMESLSGRGNILEIGEVMAGDPARYQRELQALAAATPGGVRLSAAKWLKENYHQITFHPFGELTAHNEGVDRTLGLPDVKAPVDFEFPETETGVLKNGLEVVVARRASIPNVRLSVQFDAGFVADFVDGKPQVSRAALLMMLKGAGKRSAPEFVKASDRLDLYIEGLRKLDRTALSMSVLKEKFEPGLELFADALMKPRYDSEEFELWRSKEQASLKRVTANMQGAYMHALPIILYGDADYPYNIPLHGKGTAAGIEALTTADLEAFRTRWFRPDLARIFVTGDVTLAEIMPLLEKRFGAWSIPGEKKTKPSFDIELDPQSAVYLVDRPGADSSIVAAVQMSPSGTHQDYVALRVMNEVLGADFSSRLNMNLREDKGWSYGVRSELSRNQLPGPFKVRGFVQTDKTADALNEINKEISDIIGARPVTQDELSEAKARLIWSVPGSLATSQDLLNSMMQNSSFGRPMNFAETQIREVREVDLDTVNEAARRHLHPENMAWLVIGDAEEIRADLEKLNLAPVVDLEIEP